MASATMHRDTGPKPRSRWYQEAPSTSILEPARKAGQEVQTYLLKNAYLSRKEADLLSGQHGYAIVQNCLNDMGAMLRADYSSLSSSKRTWSFVEKASQFVVLLKDIVKTLLPQSPEYTVTYGVIVLLFKAVVGKRDREESLLQLIDGLAERLPVAEAYRDLFPTNELKQTVAALYQEIMIMLQKAVTYYRSWRISKVMDVLLHPIEETFSTCQRNIEAIVKRMTELKDAALAAQQSDMKDVVDGTSKAIQQLRQQFAQAELSMASTLVAMMSKVDSIELSTQELRTFYAISRVHEIEEAFTAESNPHEDDIDSMVVRKPQLAPREAWENNGVLGPFSEWAHKASRDVFWVGGRSGDNDPWVTAFATDLVGALRSRTDCNVVFFFGTQNHEQKYSPSVIVQRMISQLLHQNPDLVFRMPGVLNASIARRAKTFQKLWNMFLQVLSQVSHVIIVLDRVDLIKDEEHDSFFKMMAPALVQLGSANANVDIILTDSYRPPPRDRLPFTFTSVFIETGLRPHEMARRLL